MASNCEICGGRHPTGDCSPEIVSTAAFARTTKMHRASLPELETGTMVGEYRVVRGIGEGGMGIVYEGVHPLLGRKVAIKILNESFARSDEHAARFLQEARAASLVRHQNIVDVFAFGQLPDGRYYEVMEFLDGKSLGDLLQDQGVLGVEAVRVIVGGVLAGLEFAHEKNIVHRDLKPDNIFVVGKLDQLDAVQVKILDFGLAKLMHDDGDVSLVKSRTGTPMGTPAYMSPEQCRAVGTIDRRSDLYSVGVILFELFSGNPPFDAPSVLEVMNMHLQTPPPSLTQLIGLPSLLQELIARALAKRPEDRHQTAEELRAALDVACFQASNYVPPPPAPRARVLELLPTAPSGPPARDASQVGAPDGENEVRLPRAWIGPLVILLILCGAVAAFVIAGSRPRPPVPPSAPPPPAVGTLRIEVTPAARVLLDGKLIGEGTTVIASAVEEGMHQLHLESESSEPHDRVVTVHQGETVTLSIPLTAKKPVAPPPPSKKKRE